MLLVEQNDLASGTSSASTKLIHGGLRYLEHGAFRLVREALHEREVLLRMAPHVIRPLRFVLPPMRGLRSALWLRLGLFIYDHLGGRKLLPGTRSVDLTHHAVGQPLKRSFRYGFEFSDCLVDDSRLVVLNALDAAERGAVIRTRTRCTRAERRDEWELVLNARGRREVATARVLVNAAGPWIGEVADTVIRRPLPAPVRLVKGSHIVVRRRFEHDCGYLLQAADGRVVFALPFAQDFTLIGTTDENFVGDLNSPAPDPDEIIYLCQTVNEYFRDEVTPDELVWSFAGVRSLYDDGADKPEDVTRDYVLGARRRRRRGAAAHDLWRQDHHPSPAGGSGDGAYRRFLRRAAAVDRRLDAARRRFSGRRLLRAGGARRSAAGRSSPSRMRGGWCAPMAGASSAFSRARKAWTICGPRFAGDLTGAEVRYLVENEWAQTADDVLWRRSKLGLQATPEQRSALSRFMASSRTAPQPAP